MLQFIDWLIIGLYFAVSIGISLIMTRKGGKNTGNFFLSGRNLPWYIAGTSMVATTFAADTPLAITEMVADHGIAGNWLWWNMLFGGILTVFFFSRLWRRSGLVTDNEFVAIRYSGKSADFLRSFRALYIGIILNVIIIGWVNLAMVKILTVMFPDLTLWGFQEVTFGPFTFSSHLVVVGLMLIFVAVYSALSGLAGTALIDSFQFLIAMTATIILAVFALKAVGGVEGMKAELPDWAFKFVPRVGEDNTGGDSPSGLLKMSVTAFVAYIGVQWWASWYPGGEPGGGSYIAQRMMSAKDEKNSLFATLLYQVLHFAVRPWPWIITALATLILYPDLPMAEKGNGFVMAIRDLMPAGLMGLLIAAFMAAFMSTIASQTVWGTSYIINDFVRPYIKKQGTEKYYVKISRITAFALILFSLIVTAGFDRVSDAWKFVLACSGGIGLVLLLRWFWWRINAWSEISALIAPYLVYPILKFHYDMEFETSLLYIVAFTTIVWLSATFLTKPEDEQTLLNFYRRIHPGGPGWRRIAAKAPDVTPDSGYGRLFVNWIAGVIIILTALYGIGKLIFLNYLNAGIAFAIMGVAIVVVYINMRKIGWKKTIK